MLVVGRAGVAAGRMRWRRRALDGRGRLGEYLRSSEAATRPRRASRPRGTAPRVFVIRPAHNPIGPFDFAGGFDDRSDRRAALTELMSRGYEDAYHQFIEPVVGASGERVGRVTASGIVVGIRKVTQSEQTSSS